MTFNGTSAADLATVNSEYQNSSRITTMQVKKRNGSYESLDLEKIHKVLEWACNGNGDIPAIKGVSVHDLEMNAKLKFFDKIKTSDIHKTLIESAVSLITEDTPNYDHVAARLVWFSVRKMAFGQNIPPHLKTVIKKNVELGFYDPAILDQYTEDELDEINSFIDHTRDDRFKFAGAEQMRLKYVTQNRRKRVPTESFQFPYIMVAATLFSDYPKDVRLQYVKEYYDAISVHDLNEPTPVMAGVRTLVRQYSSCVVVDSGDSLDSIERTGQIIMKYASKKAGLGVNIGRIRGEGQLIRGGEAISTGVLPFSKKFNGDLKCTAQGAIRGASATLNFPFWHLEFETLIELKNEKGTDETRLRTVDYSVHLNRLVWDRFNERGNITLFSPEEVPGLYDAFYSNDIENFIRLYEKYERQPGITKRTVSAQHVLEKVVTERFETTRIYPMFADTVNTQTPFLEPVTMTNLCVEVNIPTVPPTSDPEEGLVGLCTLGAVNVGKLGLLLDPKERARVARQCELEVRAKDALLDYQDYPFRESRRHVELYRPLGIGCIGFSHWMTRNNLVWGSAEAIKQVNRLMEFISFHLIKASIQLAKEKGSCQARTRYHDGWMPWDSAKTTFPKELPWDELREEAKVYGIRNGCLMAGMPSETSSQCANETNGYEAPRELITVKGSKDGALPQVVPEYAKLNHAYETAWNITAENYLRTLSPVVHYYDQGLSANTTYHPRDIPKDDQGKFLMSHFLKDMKLAYDLGYKTLYYFNILDTNQEGEAQQVDDGCESGACAI
jgi:ribonucleoside-diphosphate reductase alpha chain